ncbi:Carcinoembryonic antigen-related cell adhesion molecule 3 [Lemmus lemmus]
MVFLCSLLASLLTCWHLPTAVQPTIESVPPCITEGGSVLLLVHNPPENIKAFAWFKWMTGFKKLEIARYIPGRKATVWGPAYSGREKLHSDGSLLLHAVTQRDPGLYTLAIMRTDLRSEEAQVKLQVHKPVTQPFVQISDTTVTGGTSVIFTCVSPDTDVSIRWIFNNQSLNHLGRMTLSPTRCGLRIDPVRSEDAGEYKCEVFNQVSSKTSLPVSWP